MGAWGEGGPINRKTLRKLLRQHRKLYSAQNLGRQALAVGDAVDLSPLEFRVVPAHRHYRALNSVHGVLRR